jgi:NAD(P)-dependent dehydrogenase (short-subunit alcohol dehydrogenase family)
VPSWGLEGQLLEILKDHEYFLSGYARILITSCVESLYGSPGYLPYTASKWAIRALQETWVASSNAPGVAPSNIDLITIMPGTVNTSLGYNAIYGERAQEKHVRSFSDDEFRSPNKSSLAKGGGTKSTKGSAVSVLMLGVLNLLST